MCAAALEEYCGSVFWNDSYVNREDPDLPVCMQQTVLVWIPLGFLWLCAPYHLVSLCRRTKVERGHLSKLYLYKQLLVSLLFLTAIADLAVTIGENYGPHEGNPSTEKYPAVYYVNPGLYAVTWILLLLCQEAVRRMEGAIDSTTLFLFWLLLCVCNIFPFQSLTREAIKPEGVISDVPRFCLFFISFGLQVIALILSAVADVPPEMEESVKKNPEAGAAFLSRITFNWFNSMVAKGHKQTLTQEDLWDLKEADSTGSISKVFHSFMQLDVAAARVRLQARLKKKREKRSAKAKGEAFENGFSNGLSAGVSQDVLMMEKKGEKADKKKKNGEKADYPKSWLYPTIFKSCKKDFLISALFKVVQDILVFVSPLILKAMISFTQDKSNYVWEGYIYSLLLLLVAILQSLCLQQYFQHCFLLGIQVRTAIMDAVYKKALVMSNDNRKESTVGETMNMISADAQRFHDVTSFFHLIWSCPLQIILSVAFLWMEIGPSALIGLAVMLLVAPMNVLLTTKARLFQIDNMTCKDKRLKIMNEILNGIKILKLYAWEPSFQTQVESIREEELKVMKKFAYLSSVSSLIFTCTPVMVSVLSFAVYVLLSPDNILTPEKAFTSITIFNLLRFPLSMMPMVIAMIVQTEVSKDRLEKFLGGEDLESDLVGHDPSCDSAVSVCDCSFAWERDAEPLLKDMSLDIKPGRLVAVVGAVGCGKSSLISALLGEMHKVKGSVNIQGSLAYVPQQAWIQNATLRDNIMFGSPTEERRLQEVIEATALCPDLELLPAGDMTEIGEKGINLSGGQKQRISLARAVYSQADVYLLDDPLSAVDSHVGKHIFDKVIGPNGLLKDKTRVLVTHGMSFLPYVDEVVVLLDGVISEVGSYKSLRASKGAFSEFLDTYAQEERKRTYSDSSQDTTDLPLVSESEDTQVDSALEDTVTVTLKRENSLRRSKRYGSIRKRKNSGLKEPESAGKSKEGERIIEKETMETGQVKFSVYLQYMRAIGWVYSIGAVGFFTAFSSTVVGQNIWLSEWTNDAVVYYNRTYPDSKRDTRIGVYAALGFLQAIFAFLATLLLASGSITASRILHSRLLNNILRVPMVFFDTTPLGRVVNRFAKDIYTIDEAIPMSVRSWIQCLLSVLSTLMLIWITTPIFIAITVPLAVVYYIVQRFYLRSSRQLRRLDSVSRSPIYSHFGETVSGLSVIRAYGHQERFLEKNETILDENLRSVYPWIMSNRWLAIRLEFIGNLVVFFSALLAVIYRNTLDSSLVGLSISSALNITQSLNWLVRMNTELETNIVAVERVSEYSEIENEAEWVNDNRPPENWPEEGKLEFDNYMVRYRPGLDLVLHGISCDIKGTEKIGIVGRTGAGKSSLTNCLFRTIESAGGRIIIDGIDISTIGLHDLRSRLTIIPQDPVLFSGSLRMNLDPFDRFSDENIWRVLELSHLTDFVGGLSEKLQYEVTEGGENLSVGQRQLLCLARALLRKSRILILDEATAAVDLETDSLIQKTIRKEFAQCTILTIAHRLHSILDSSRVMVLDAGQIVEFDSPSNLFEKRGLFYAMSKDAGITGGNVTAL
ncbi:canalicular multispecific organic anion transporter 1 [Hippoglossus stenolepis]|uniref:canalicular multispecific organic anion transporter 1 n=1 Tax=Hippoglossus stenolepis TaxID=195615 RepID=UPI00159C948B|nr:canalicular multispecific organic anion transporter 1 [Hippoglossus stenolepis]